MLLKLVTLFEVCRIPSTFFIQLQFLPLIGNWGGEVSETALCLLSIMKFSDEEDHGLKMSSVQNSELFVFTVAS